MYNPIEEIAKARQAALLEEARIERSLRTMAAFDDDCPDNSGLRDRFLSLAGDWMIALGRRMHNAAHGCASQPLSEGKV